MKIFIAGIMQGSKLSSSLHSQDYRTILKQELLKAFPDSIVYDPFEFNKNSLSYSDKLGRKVFLSHNKMCGSDIDVLVAFAPEASMGTAIEMWEAWKNGATVVTISPMETNWVIKYLTDVLFTDLDDFIDALSSGEIQSKVTCRPKRERRREFDQADVTAFESTTNIDNFDPQ